MTKRVQDKSAAEREMIDETRLDQAMEIEDSLINASKKGVGIKEEGFTEMVHLCHTCSIKKSDKNNYITSSSQIIEILTKLSEIADLGKVTLNPRFKFLGYGSWYIENLGEVIKYGGLWLIPDNDKSEKAESMRRACARELIFKWIDNMVKDAGDIEHFILANTRNQDVFYLADGVDADLVDFVLEIVNIIFRSDCDGHPVFQWVFDCCTASKVASDEHPGMFRVKIEAKVPETKKTLSGTKRKRSIPTSDDDVLGSEEDSEAIEILCAMKRKKID